MKIVKVELHHISIPLKKAFYSSWIPGYPQTHNRFTLLRLTTDDDREGLAAGVAFGDEREGLGGLLAPYILGIDPCDTELAHQRMREASYLGWRNFWMEAAFFDIKAQVADVPVWKMLGGSDEPLPVYWSTGSVCEPKRHAKIVEQAQSEGYSGTKLRVKSKSLEDDVSSIRKTRALVDAEFPLMVDSNSGWPVTIVDNIPAWDLERAQAFVEEVSDQNLWWLEEPLDMHAYEEMAELRKVSPIKLAGAELNAGWNEARIFLHFESLDIYQPDVTVFGFKDTLKTLSAVQERDLGFSPHTWTNGVGLWTNMHVAAVADRNLPLEYPHEPGSWTPEFRDGILRSPIVPKDGFLELPDDPGLGIPIDWDRVKQFGTKFFSMTEGDLRKKVMKEKGIVTALKLKRRKDKEANE
ncbi:MAG: mandelate racemase/muconate lactonizing enzyme family protein [Candidatus Thorarchaeota archaeon]|nr:MAG: mandelate racemase/muconate lactonizing enzyme family protein [Candidatus Thorarchaeota archaeon]